MDFPSYNIVIFNSKLFVYQRVRFIAFHGIERTTFLGLIMSTVFVRESTEHYGKRQLVCCQSLLVDLKILRNDHNGWVSSPITKCQLHVYQIWDSINKYIYIYTGWGPQDSVQLRYQWLNSMVYSRYN